MGNVVQAGAKMNPARQAAVHAGLPVTAPALTVNRVCGSGAQAIVSAAGHSASDRNAALNSQGACAMSMPPGVVIGLGAERSLGAALCRRFAEEGYHILVAGRTPEKLARSICEKGGGAEAVGEA